MDKKILNLFINKLKTIKTNDMIITFYDIYQKKIKEIYETNEIGEKCGVYKLYYKNGNIKKKIDYYDGIYHGLYYNYYPSGRWKKFKFYDDNILEREIVTYYDDKKGTIKSSMEYHGGQKHGYGDKYYKNGKKKESFQYERGIQCGTHYFYNKKGKIIKKIKIEKNI